MHQYKALVNANKSPQTLAIKRGESPSPPPHRGYNNDWLSIGALPLTIAIVLFFDLVIFYMDDTN
jgi:hypothetical protein